MTTDRLKNTIPNTLLQCNPTPLQWNLSTKSPSEFNQNFKSDTATLLLTDTRNTTTRENITCSLPAYSPFSTHMVST